MKPIGVILKLTLREAARRKVLWGLLILGVLFLVLYNSLRHLFVPLELRHKLLGEPLFHAKSLGYRKRHGHDRDKGQQRVKR